VNRPRAMFFGTPEFAVPALAALHELADVVLVITQPDRPKGRGMKLASPPVKLLAERLGLRVEQPSKVRTPEFARMLREQRADLALVVAYGRILTSAVLEAPRLGCVNVHASLLPRYRGAAPIQWALVKGERETGVCLMQMDAGLDTGPVLARASLAIDPDETAAALAERLAQLGAATLRAELPRVFAGELVPQPQPHELASLAPLLHKRDGAIDWTRSARSLHDQVRGFNPWPSAYAQLAGTPLKIHRSQVEREQGSFGEAGLVLASERAGILVACGSGSIRLCELQLEGGRKLMAADFLAGHPVPAGARFGSPVGPE
jgi:methionyl-tRNA formyltransferase